MLSRYDESSGKWYVWFDGREREFSSAFEAAEFMRVKKMLLKMREDIELVLAA